MDKRKRRLLCMLEGSGRKSRWISGAPPLSFKAFAAGELENYRIYGNTVNGESVGDRTGNLFDMKKFAETASQSYATINYSENSLIFIAKKIDAYVNEVYSNTSQTIPSALRPACINVQPRTTYTITMNSPYKCLMSWLDDSFTPVRGYGIIPNNQSSFTFETPENCTKLLFRLGKQVENVGDTFVISNIILNSGATPLPYEPYGYKVPVTVSNGTDTQTIPIYLPEQIKKVGDEAEYIDYAEQKMHRIGADDINVTLPALPTLTGTNVLSVGTAVQPSEIEVKGKIKAL